jgi:hypothetical protein
MVRSPVKPVLAGRWPVQSRIIETTSRRFDRERPLEPAGVRSTRFFRLPGLAVARDEGIRRPAPQPGFGDVGIAAAAWTGHNVAWHDIGTGGPAELSGKA